VFVAAGSTVFVNTRGIFLQLLKLKSRVWQQLLWEEFKAEFKHLGHLEENLDAKVKWEKEEGLDVLADK
jgi:hypothetical protein